MNVTFLNKQGRVNIECREGETLLQAGLRQGVPLPYSCGAGVCSTCIARSKPGTVTSMWPQAPGAQNLNTAKGECLLCQCVPVSNCEILVPGKVVLTENSGMLPQHQFGQLVNLEVVAPSVATFELELDQSITCRAGGSQKHYSTINSKQRGSMCSVQWEKQLLIQPKKEISLVW